MTVNVECLAEVQAEEGQPLLAVSVREWLEPLPLGAAITPILHDTGTQRDPDVRLVGLRATWSESRSDPRP